MKMLRARPKAELVDIELAENAYSSDLVRPSRNDFEALIRTPSVPHSSRLIEVPRSLIHRLKGVLQALAGLFCENTH